MTVITPSVYVLCAADCTVMSNAPSTVDGSRPGNIARKIAALPGPGQPDAPGDDDEEGERPAHGPGAVLELHRHGPDEQRQQAEGGPPGGEAGGSSAHGAVRLERQEGGGVGEREPDHGQAPE